MLELDKIYLGDCLDLMKKIPDKSIDIAFIDPPYNVGKDYGEYKDNLNQDEYYELIKNVINEFKRITKRGFGIYLDWKQFQKYWNFIPEAEPIIIFKKSTGAIHSPLKIAQHHHVILTTIKALKPIKSVWDDIRVYGEGYFFNEEKFGHPAQTSLKATKRYIETFSEKGEIVIDCFSGSGTTAVACYNLNRNFICIELDKNFYEKSVKRLENVKAQTRIF